MVPAYHKIDTMVDFPLEGLNLAPFVTGPTYADAPPTYDLYGVIEHVSGGNGGGCTSGHYTAKCKQGNTW